MIIESTRLGKLEVSQEDIIHFSKGIPGFPGEREFALLPCEPNSPFAFMQSVIEPNLTFLVVEPFAFFVEYEFSLEEEIVTDLKLTEDNPPYIFNIVTIPEKSDEMTANLLAPIVLNLRSRSAQQIVLEKSLYHTRHRLFPEGIPNLENKGGR